MSAGDTLYLKIGKNIVVTDRRVTLGDVAKMECTDQAALFGPVHRFCRAGQRAFRTGLDLTDDNGPIRLLHHNIQLTHPGVEVVCQQPAALLLIPAGRSCFSPAPCLGAVHFPFSGQ